MQIMDDKTRSGSKPERPTNVRKDTNPINSQISYLVKSNGGTIVQKLYYLIL